MSHMSNDAQAVSQFIRSSTLLFVILNPFLMTIYLIPIAEKLKPTTFRRVLFHGSLTSFVVFVVFALTGDRIFTNVLQVRFGAFLVFGGLVFLIIALRFVLIGPDAIEQLYGKPAHVSGAIAMPFMIGPGTVSASILAGARMSPPWAIFSILTGLLAALLCILALREILNRLRSRHEVLVQRYVDVVGRVSAVIMGTIAVQMSFNGLDLWLGR